MRVSHLFTFHSNLILYLFNIEFHVNGLCLATPLTIHYTAKSIKDRNSYEVKNNLSTRKIKRLDVLVSNNLMYGSQYTGRYV